MGYIVAVTYLHVLWTITNNQFNYWKLFNQLLEALLPIQYTRRVLV